MNWRTNCGVVIPCLNEEAAIGSLLASVRSRLPTVVVVDDGSTDETATIAARSGAVVLRHQDRRGKGSALCKGLDWMSKHGYGWALLMDGDGQHSPDDIPRFLQAAESGRATMIIGNRMEQPGSMPWARRWANRWMSRRLSRLTGHHLADSQCGFRLISVPIWAQLPIRSQHFEIESELLWEFIRAGETVEFIPVQVIYRGERTKICPLLDAIRWWKWLSRARDQRCKGVNGQFEPLPSRWNSTLTRARPPG